MSFYQSFSWPTRLKILMSSGSKKGAQIYLFFSLKNPGKRTSSMFPNRAPMERQIPVNILQGICISLESLIKIPLSKKALKKKRTSMFPKSRWMERHGEVIWGIFPWGLMWGIFPWGGHVGDISMVGHVGDISIRGNVGDNSMGCHVRGYFHRG